MANSCIEPKVAPVRTPDKLDPVGKLVRGIFPGAPYVVLVWNEERDGKRFVEMITNCEVSEAAERMRECVKEFDDASTLRKIVGRSGHACLVPGLSFAVLQAVLDKGFSE